MEVVIRMLHTRRLAGNRTLIEGEAYTMPVREAEKWVRSGAAEFVDGGPDKDDLPSTSPRDGEFWTPDLRFAGQMVFIVGGGNSLRGFDFELLRGLKTIAINSAAKHVDWADMLFFMDGGWFRRNRAFVKEWAGAIAAVTPAAKRGFPDHVFRIAMAHADTFPPAGTSPIRWGRSSGHVAVSLAVAMGAARIVLLGFDMCETDGKTHFHDDYQNADSAVYAREFIPAFDGWNEAALVSGVEIVNATPGSALTEFPMVDLTDEITRAKELA